MRIGQVIGKTVMSVQDDALKGGRWLIVSPLDASQFSEACSKKQPISAQSSLIVYDNIGAGEGDVIGFSEGAEATAPFSEPIPIDALCIAIFDSIDYTPYPAV
jgi:carbon dioxide concentrating mechanism protein CcmL